MNKIQRAMSGLFGTALMMASGYASADWELNLTEGVTDISRKVYDMHMMVLWICFWIGVVVFGAMIYSMIKHRKSKGNKPATFHESTFAEIVWTIIPFAILVMMAIPAAKTLIAMEDTSDAEITVKITGHQWKWEYEYIDSGVKFISSLHADHREAAVVGSGIDPNTVDNYLLEVDNRMVLPVGKKIRFLLTASDVIHAWWIPAFAVKKDAIPGFINEMWTNIDEEGVYRGQCAELCGKDHGFMPIVVEAVSESVFDEWIQTSLAAQEDSNSLEDMSMEDLMARGETVYGTYCAACHQANGEGIQGVFPALKDSPIALGNIEDHINIILNGAPGTAMQAFAAQLNDADIAAVTTYERNAWGNDVGDLAQPTAVNALRVQ